MGDISRQIGNLYSQAAGAIYDAFEDSGSKRNPLALTQAERAIRAARQAKECFEKIAALQAKCAHTWHFNRQDSTGDGVLWDVAYKCPECNSERRERKPPVCSFCDHTIEKVRSPNHGTEFVRLQAQSGDFRTPIVFRCPKCRSLHALWYEMD